MRDNKEFWVGINIKVVAKNEEEAGNRAQHIADMSQRDYSYVVDAYWDNNLPEEEYHPEEEQE